MQPGHRRDPAQPRPRLTVLPADVSAEAEPGESLLDAGEQAGVEMEAGCLDCSCGTCVVEVVEGLEQLEAPSPKELEVLDAWSRDPEKYRLACCTRLKSGPVTIRQLD